MDVDLDELSSPFSDEVNTDIEDDTWMEPAQLMQNMVGVRRSAGPLGEQDVGLADELDPGELQVPEPEELGRGKRRRRVTQKYGAEDFVAH